MARPIISPNVKLAAVENGYLAYDELGRRLHRLNPFGALIVELCDGERTVDDICGLLEPLLPPEDQPGGIDKWIREGVEAGLLVWGDAPPRVVSEDELPDLAVLLRQEGEYEAAYLCRKRYAESSPENPAAWRALGDIAQRAGLRSQAANAYARHLELLPENAEIRHLLVALRDETPPPRCSDACVREIFDGFAEHFDTRLRDDLEYQAPERLRDLVDAEVGAACGLRILDIGCGTGLSGAALKHRAGRLVGVDLTPEMLELARKRGIYDSLELAEITEWLGREGERFDLVTACDCLIYFGDLAEVARAVAGRLQPGGWFAFTLERSDRHPFRLTDSGRYAHHANHVREVAAGAGLAVARLGQGFLRMELGEEVTGLYVLLAKPTVAGPE